MKYIIYRIIIFILPIILMTCIFYLAFAFITFDMSWIINYGNLTRFLFLLCWVFGLSISIYASMIFINEFL